MRMLRAVLLIWAVNSLLAQGPAESFDVASVKPSAAGARERIVIEPGGRFLAEGVSLKFLVGSAWHLAAYQISGGENWIASEPWTIQATAEGIIVPSWAPPFLPDIISTRVRTLVNDRFALRMHRETRDMAVYRLSIGKNGPGLKVTQSPDRPQTDSSSGPQPFGGRSGHPEDVVPPPGRAIGGPGVVLATAIPEQQLVMLLGRQLDRPIVDQTGLTGYVDVRLRFAPESAPRSLQVSPSPDGAVPAPSDDPSIFTAIEEQLGLKLDLAREPIDVLIIDSARRPTAN
jgi:uncharacterized protein (TIGR03435 family)